MMIPRVYLQTIKKELLSYAEQRRSVIVASDEALHLSKRAIFSLHRQDHQEAAKKLDAAVTLLRGVKKAYPRHNNEGSYKAAQEEFVEATLFFQFVTKGSIGKVTTFPVSSDIYIAGLCDLPGELYRYAIAAATQADSTTVSRCATLSQEVVGELIEYNLTSYLRTKFDQATQATQKIEHIVYELSLKQK